MILKIKKHLIMTLCGCALLLGLTGCGNLDVRAAPEQRRDGRTPEEEEAQESGEPKEGGWIAGGPRTGNRRSREGWTTAKLLKWKPVKESEFGSISYFRDDTGSNTQLADGWLYGYWSRKLCRINVDTLETEVLYETASPQNGTFGIYEGYVYFLEQPNISYLEEEKANLLRVKCDGSEPELLAESFYAPKYNNYRINIYDGILYLTCLYGEPETYRFFRLTESGEAKEISVEETLYGMLPEGYVDACEKYKYDGIPNLVCCFSRFGYAFVSDDADRLYRINLESGKMEEFPLPEPDNSGKFTLTNDALIYMADDDIWHSINLDMPGSVTEIGKLDSYDMDFWDEKGIYYVDRKYGEKNFSVVRLGWDGETKTLRYWVRNPRLSNSVYGDNLNVLYSDGTYLYYDSLEAGDGVICRILLEEDGDDEEEQVFVYYDNPVKDISTRETFTTTFTVEDTGDIGSFSITKVCLTEETEAAEKINAFLEEQYSAEEEYMVSFLDEVRDMAFSEWKSDWSWSYTMVDAARGVSVDYIDDNYIGFCSYWYEYRNGAAHGNYGSVEFVFSRATGERLQITDVVENSEEEICAIIAPYVEAQADWGTDEEGWEETILDDGRFYLAAEGIGIHFDVYELTCYAAGALDVIVPYGEFELRNPEEVGLSHF